MPLSIPAMIAEMHRLRDELEHGVVGTSTKELEGIFGAAEVELSKQQGLFETLLTDPDGKIQNIPANLESAGAYYREVVEPQIADVLTAPGKQWAEKNVDLMHKAGRRLAGANLDVAGLSPEKVKAVFDNVSVAEKGILKVGYTSGYQIMNTVGDDVGVWFRQTMMDSVVEGIPVDHHNPNVDSLKSRLIAGGRIKPITIKSSTGKTIHRSIKQRAQAIARIESTRIINRTHEQLAEDSIGDEAVFRNSNPQDSRSTYICEHASQQKAMSLEEWDNTIYGRPPRLSPFHLCRSVLIGGRAEWFEDVPESELQGAGLAKTAKAKAPTKDAKQKAAQTASVVAQEALQEAATIAVKEIAQSTKAAKAATMAKDIDGLLSSPNAAALDTHIQKLLTEFQAIAPAAEWAAKKKLATAVVKKGKLQELSTSIESGISGAAKTEVDLAVSINANLPVPKPLYKSLKAPDSPIPEIGKSTLGPLLKQVDDLDLPESADLLGKWETNYLQALDYNIDTHKLGHMDIWVAAENVEDLTSQLAIKQHAFDNMKKSGLFEPASLAAKTDVLQDLMAKVEATKSVAKLEEYQDLLDLVAVGKLGPKKLITTQKKITALGEELQDLKPGLFGAGDVVEDIQSALDSAASKVNPEILAFHAEYQKLVTTKKITPVQAGEILEKYKAGALHGKSSAKAKQAVDAIKEKLDPPAPIVPDAPAPPPSLTGDAFAQVDENWHVIDPTFETGWQSQGTANIGGAHSKEFWLDPLGSRWMFKPFPSVSKKEATFRGMADEFAYKMQRLVDPAAAEARFVNMPDGRAGSIQRWIDGADGTLKGVPLSDLTKAQLGVVQREHVLDWLISNHDGHSGQIITFPDGRLVGVDKGQAFKFLGDDKLDFDYHPNSAFGESEPIYNTLMKGLRDGDLDLDPNVTLEAIEKFEGIADDTYRALLDGYAANRFNSAAARKKFLDAAVTRKNSLRSDFEQYYRRALGDDTFTFGQQAAPVPAAPATAAVKIPQSFAEVADAAEGHGFQGRSIDLGGEDVEDFKALIFADEFQGKTRTNIDLKLRASGDAKIMKWINAQDIEDIAPSTATAAPEVIGDPLKADIFAPNIQQAVITLNSHVKKGDFEFNQSTLADMHGLKPQLNALLSNVDPDVAAMAKAYLKVIEDVDQNVGAKTALNDFGPDVAGGLGFSPYKRKQLFDPDAGKAVEAAPPAAKVKVTKEDFHVTHRRPDKGKLVATDDRFLAQEVHSDYYGKKGVQYAIEFEDGTRIRYRPIGHQNDDWFAKQGSLEVMIPEKPSGAMLERALAHFDELGLERAASDPLDLELMYLTKQAYSTKEHVTASYKAMIELLDEQGADKATRVAAMVKHWGKKKAIKDRVKAAGVSSLKDLPEYNPSGVFRESIHGTGSSAGYRAWSRFDVTDGDVSDFVLQHNLTANEAGGMGGFFKQVLANNGVMASSVEKMRIGVPVGGMSPGADMTSGGASYFFTRIRRRAQMSSGHMYFKGSSLRRMDAIPYAEDSYGRVTGQYVTDNRKPKPSQWASIAEYSGNETNFKASLSLIDDIDSIHAPASQHAAIIKAYKDAGYAILPDGRKIEEVVK